MNKSDDLNKEPASAGSDKPCACGASWKLPLFLAAVLAAIIVVNGRGVRQPSTSEGAANEKPASNSQLLNPATSPVETSQRQVVSLTVDFGNGQRRDWPEIPWREGTTVASALAHNAENSEGKFSYSWQGTDTAEFLLTEMSGVANEGAGQRNWIYRVNGKRADRSFGVYELRPGDEVLWTFEARQ